jgi:hypothetical protein
VIGGIANPCVFVVAAFDPDFWEKTILKIYSAVCFIITTIGFAWVGITLLVMLGDRDPGASTLCRLGGNEPQQVMHGISP